MTIVIKQGVGLFINEACKEFNCIPKLFQSKVSEGKNLKLELLECFDQGFTIISCGFE